MFSFLTFLLVDFWLIGDCRGGGNMEWMKEPQMDDGSMGTCCTQGQNLYAKDRYTRVNDSAGFIDYRYGVMQTENGFICIQCKQADKAKRVLTIHDVGFKELINQCECGNFMVIRSYRYKPNHQGRLGPFHDPTNGLGNRSKCSHH